MRGLTERQIAKEVQLSPGRVHEIIEERIAAHLGPVVGSMVALRDAELDDLWRKAQAQYVATDDPDTRLKAVNTLKGLNESRRKLHGADAPEALRVSLERRIEQEATDVVEAILAGFAAVSLPEDRRQYGLEAASACLRAGEPGAFTPPEPLPPLGAAPTPYTENGAMYIDGPGGLRYRVVAVEPQGAPTVTRLALPPGPSAPPPGEPDSADAVLEQLAKFEDEFGSLEDDDED
ncbi:predicted protein [Streptomyces viridochromogenes DSM 40736]|uniref:Predicted protein n=1 Tax=Streptomyces viridochromogenes (strain DSM 40736 / JCM 4977 / BCRC 1201 / Tue 494) TaxID=591159 RepID=D9X0B7_STRVT|nr:hypothetical protein [Streptomyces viridochromogenes]EFL35501.1 predicted protein [Streptomyces viridochromogenes DSM 40736]